MSSNGSEFDHNLPHTDLSEVQIPNTVQLKKEEGDLQITFSLLLVSFVFLVLTAPMYLIDVVYQIKDPYLSPDAYATFTFTVNLGARLYVTTLVLLIYSCMVLVARSVEMTSRNCSLFPNNQH